MKGDDGFLNGFGVGSLELGFGEWACFAGGDQGDDLFGLSFFRAVDLILAYPWLKGDLILVFRMVNCVYLGMDYHPEGFNFSVQFLSQYHQKVVCNG